METLTVVIADDHQFFRDGVRALLDAQADMECVGEASTGEEVIGLSAELQPDVVLMDVQRMLDLAFLGQIRNAFRNDFETNVW